MCICSSARLSESAIANRSSQLSTNTDSVASAPLNWISWICSSTPCLSLLTKGTPTLGVFCSSESHWLCLEPCCTMVFQYFLKLWHLYLVGCLAFWIRCFLLGYDIISIISPHFFQPDLPPDFEQLLELREELLDLDLREALQECELELLPMEITTSSSEFEPNSALDSDS